MSFAPTAEILCADALSCVPVSVARSNPRCAARRDHDRPTYVRAARAGLRTSQEPLGVRRNRSNLGSVRSRTPCAASNPRSTGGWCAGAVPGCDPASPTAPLRPSGLGDRAADRGRVAADFSDAAERLHDRCGCPSRWTSRTGRARWCSCRPGGRTPPWPPRCCHRSGAGSAGSPTAGRRRTGRNRRGRRTPPGRVAEQRERRLGVAGQQRVVVLHERDRVGGGGGRGRRFRSGGDAAGGARRRRGGRRGGAGGVVVGGAAAGVAVTLLAGVGAAAGVPASDPLVSTMPVIPPARASSTSAAASSGARRRPATGPGPRDALCSAARPVRPALPIRSAPSARPVAYPTVTARPGPVARPAGTRRSMG